MKLIIPMAGRGKRFVDAGEKKPKMLIPIRGKSMMAWALDSLDFIPKEDWVFVVLQEHIENWELDKILIRTFGNEIKIVKIPEVTAGQACTVELAKRHYGKGEPIVIHNTDTYFKSATLEKNISELGNSVDGVIGVFKSDNPSYSYVELTKDNVVVRVVEKEVVSNFATSGLYAFAKARYFLDALQEAVDEHETVKGEYYVGPLYNRLIRNNLKIKIDVCSDVYDFGKPENVERFNKKYSGQT